MKHYSRQLDRFIEAEIYATSAYRETDQRTWMRYFIDNDGMIHSSSFNYSLLASRPVTVDEFKKFVSHNPDAKVKFIN